jgi:uncharacterized protein YndB with AHSA1/START domain
MSHTFTDENLMQWEAFASSGNFGFAERPKLVFTCLSDPDRRPRYVERPGDEADAEEQVMDYDEHQLRELFRQSKPLE